MKNEECRMKKRAWPPGQTLCWLGFIILHSSFCLQSWGQYSLDWHTTDGGGGASPGGVYSVSGTVGQPDAGGPMTGGNYSLTGGFWAFAAAVQAPGAPLLSIIPSGPGAATISWSPAAPGWVLQENLDLTTTNWVNSPSGATNPIVVPATLPTKYFRLVKP
jgi:hypothetical protein